MKRTHLQIVMATLLAIGLVACGREQVAPAASAQAIDGKLKDDGKKANPADNAPKVVDPLKDGY
jgi:hypothetical protein